MKVTIAIEVKVDAAAVITSLTGLLALYSASSNTFPKVLGVLAPRHPYKSNTGCNSSVVSPTCLSEYQ